MDATDTLAGLKWEAQVAACRQMDEQQLVDLAAECIRRQRQTTNNAENAVRINNLLDLARVADNQRYARFASRRRWNRRVA